MSGTINGPHRGVSTADFFRRMAFRTTLNSSSKGARTTGANSSDIIWRTGNRLISRMITSEEARTYLRQFGINSNVYEGEMAEFERYNAALFKQEIETIELKVHHL